MYLHNISLHNSKCCRCNGQLYHKVFSLIKDITFILCSVTKLNGFQTKNQGLIWSGFFFLVSDFAISAVGYGFSHMHVDVPFPTTDRYFQQSSHKTILIELFWSVNNLLLFLKEILGNNELKVWRSENSNNPNKSSLHRVHKIKSFSAMLNE